MSLKDASMFSQRKLPLRMEKIKQNTNGGGGRGTNLTLKISIKQQLFTGCQNSFQGSGLSVRPGGVVGRQELDRFRQTGDQRGRLLCPLNTNSLYIELFCICTSFPINLKTPDWALAFNMDVQQILFFHDYLFLKRLSLLQLQISFFTFYLCVCMCAC